MPGGPKWMNDALEGLMGSLMRTMTVEKVHCINPHIKITRLKGDLLGFNFQIGYAVIIRVSDTAFRNYTASFVDVANGILEIISHIHGDAPGSSFFAALTAGDSVRVSMPRGQKQYEPNVKQHLVFGDETSLGLACSFYPYLKKNNHEFQFYFELNEENKNVPGQLGLESYHVFPKSRLFRNEEWVGELPVFRNEVWTKANFILSGNVKSVQSFRKVLKHKNVSGKIFTKGYWLEGKTGL